MWRLAQNPSRFVKRLAPHEDVDWSFGNPLTFDDDRSHAYGVPRFHAQEGLFGSQLSQRTGLVKGERWFRRQSQIDLEMAMVASILHSYTLHYHRIRGTAAIAGPSPSGGGGHPPPSAAPPLALAA